MLIIAANIKRGMCVSIDGRPCIVDSCNAIKYGKGAAFVVADLHDIVFNTPHSVRLNPMDRIEKNELVTKRVQYLRRDGDDHIFADWTTGEEVAVPNDFLGEDIRWPKEDGAWKLLYLDGNLYEVIPPFWE